MKVRSGIQALPVPLCGPGARSELQRAGRDRMSRGSAVRAGDSVGTDALAAALNREHGLLAELNGILRRQREGLAVDDLDVVDTCVLGANRVIRTLAEARRCRGAVLEGLGGSGGTPLEDLEGTLRGGVTPDVIVAREKLWAEAAGVDHEIERNRRVLRHVLRLRSCPGS